MIYQSQKKGDKNTALFEIKINLGLFEF